MPKISSSEIERIREKLGLSRRELADLFGVSQAKTIEHWEKGHRNPGALTIIMFRVLDSLSKDKAESLIKLMRNHGETR